MEVKSESEVALSCLTLSNPMDCSLPGSSIHGIFQARVLEWGAITFLVQPKNKQIIFFFKEGNRVTQEIQGGEGHTEYKVYTVPLYPSETKDVPAVPWACGLCTELDTPDCLLDRMIGEAAKAGGLFSTRKSGMTQKKVRRGNDHHGDRDAMWCREEHLWRVCSWLRRVHTGKV